jgi:hypothetical protein
VRFDDLVPAHGPWPEGAAPARRRARRDLLAPGPTRRSFLGGALAAGGAVGLAALGVFPRARAALAAPTGVGYRVHTGGCPSYASGHECQPGCGPSPVYADTCEPSGSYRGWFKNRPSSGYRLRPGQCLSGYDAWVWRFSGRCGWCQHSIEYRCHDGYKLIGGVWFNAICRRATRCDGRSTEGPATHSPVGEVTYLHHFGDGTVRIRGWAIDPDATGRPVEIKVRDNGRIVATQRAGLRSNEIPPLFRRFGRRHGFNIVVRLGPGAHRLRVHAATIGPGRNVLLLERVVRV